MAFLSRVRGRRNNVARKRRLRRFSPACAERKQHGRPHKALAFPPKRRNERWHIPRIRKRARKARGIFAQLGRIGRKRRMQRGSFRAQQRNDARRICLPLCAAAKERASRCIAFLCK